MKTRLWLILVPLVLLFGCLGTQVKDDAARLGVSFAFGPQHGCSTISPAIDVSGVPAGTVKFKVRMVDLDKPTYNHGGGTVPNDGSGTIPGGALKSYKGPCPPSGSHRYRITVHALDSEGVAIGVGEYTQSYP